MYKPAIAVAVLVAVLGGISTSHAAKPVDLNVPGSLEAIERDNPRHFAKIQQVLEEIQDQPTETVPTWMQTNFDARAVTYADLLMVSDPPKKRLAFSLDETEYVVVITLMNLEPHVDPLV